MKLAQAQNYAAKIVEWLTPHCERIEIAGSIRRGLDWCNDVDVVCIPKVSQCRDMFGTVTDEHNLLWVFLSAHVTAGKAKWQTGGSVPGKFAILQLPKCQLDVYFAAPENFASRFLCRTGSKEHNIWLAQRCLDQGKEWKPYEGIFYPGHPAPGKLIQFQSETEIYASVDLKFIEPVNRNEPWMRDNL